MLGKAAHGRKGPSAISIRNVARNERVGNMRRKSWKVKVFAWSGRIKDRSPSLRYRGRFAAKPRGPRLNGTVGRLQVARVVFSEVPRRFAAAALQEPPAPAPKDGSVGNPRVKDQDWRRRRWGDGGRSAQPGCSSRTDHPPEGAPADSLNEER